MTEYEGKLESRLNRTLERLRGAKAKISKSAAIAWVRRAGSETLLDELELTDPGQRTQLKDIIEAYISMRNLMEADKPDLALLRECYALKNKKASPTDHAELAREIQSSIASLPGDVFYFSGVSGREDFGLFAMLRYISQCDIADLAISPNDLRFGVAKAKRFARLNSPYVFALAQNLARVFSDIGLPKAYKDRRKNNPVLYCDSIYGEKA